MKNTDYQTIQFAAAKKILRKQIIAERNEFDEYSYQDSNNIIYKNIIDILNSLNINQVGDDKKLSYLNKKNIIGLYWSVRGEPDLLKIAAVSGCYTALPKIYGRDMLFAKYNLGDEMEKSEIPNLYQPKSTLDLQPKIIIIPALAISINGYRLGFGKGYYDRYLNKIKDLNSFITIGVCFHKWLKQTIPYESFDCKLDYVVTDQYIIKT